MTNIDSRLNELYAKTARYNKLQNIIKEHTTQINKLNLRLSISNENNKFDDNSGKGQPLSLSSFFNNLMGKNKVTDKDSEEAQAAKIKHEFLVNELNSAKTNLKAYEAELRSLEGSKREYERLLNQKIEILKYSGGIYSAKTITYQEEILALKNNIKEIYEAINVCKLAIILTDTVLESLSNARGHAQYATFTKKGLFSNMAKYNHLDDAQSALKILQTQIISVKAELSQISIDEETKKIMDSFDIFADYFFDSIFTDIGVLERIEHSIADVTSAKEKIERIVESLEKLVDTSEKQMLTAQEEFLEFVRKTELQNGYIGMHE